MPLHPKFFVFEPKTAHAPLSPSSADRWFKCAGSYLQEKRVYDATTGSTPEPTSKAALQGTLAHEVLEAVLLEDRFGILPKEGFSEKIEQQLSAFNCECSYADLVPYAHEFIGAVAPLIEDKVKQTYIERIEASVPIIIEPEELCFGTADYLLANPEHIVVVDYKFGKGHAVSPDTLQLKLYALGVWLHHDNKDKVQITVGIHQPRIHPGIQTYTYTPKDMYKFHQQVLARIITITDPSSIIDLTIGNHCTFCIAKSSNLPADLQCSAYREKDNQALKEDFSEILTLMQSSTKELEEKDRHEMSMKLMALYPRIQRLYDRITNEYTQRLHSGETIDGLKLETVEGRRSWAKVSTEELVNDLKRLYATELLGKDLTKQPPPKMITLTQIEKFIGHKVNAKFTTRSSKQHLKIDTELRDDFEEQLLNLGDEK